MEEIPLSVWLFIAYFAIPFSLVIYFHTKRIVSDSIKRHKSKVSSSHKT